MRASVRLRPKPRQVLPPSDWVVSYRRARAAESTKDIKPNPTKSSRLQSTGASLRRHGFEKRPKATDRNIKGRDENEREPSRGSHSDSRNEGGIYSEADGYEPKKVPQPASWASPHPSSDAFVGSFPTNTTIRLGGPLSLKAKTLRLHIRSSRPPHKGRGGDRADLALWGSKNAVFRPPILGPGFICAVSTNVFFF
nr:uncharacterized protein LOC127490513 [Oryctolagus cuniculus]